MPFFGAASQPRVCAFKSGLLAIFPAAILSSRPPLLASSALQIMDVVFSKRQFVATAPEEFGRSSALRFIISELNGEIATSAKLDTNRDAKLSKIEATRQRTKINQGRELL
jgi:hypothetical protein